MRYFLDRNTTVRRLRRKSTNLSAYSATGTAYDCSFQDPSADRIQLVGGQIGKTYDIYVPDSSADIDAGDEVVIRGIRYTVRAKEVVDFGGMPHIALIAVLVD
jgi:hypothetical protein